MPFYPKETNLNTLYELNNLTHNIVYAEEFSIPGATGVGAPTLATMYPVTITTTQPDPTVATAGSTITGYYSSAFNNVIKYRTVDDQFKEVTRWRDIAVAIADQTLSELYYYKADTRARIVYSYTASANGHTQTYTVNVDNDWMTGRNALIKYTNFTRYQQKILVQWINNNTDKVTWLNKVLEAIDWENRVL
jgi:hypothetical protein